VIHVGDLDHETVTQAPMRVVDAIRHLAILGKPCWNYTSGIRP
jgi:hypothetical protein